MNDPNYDDHDDFFSGFLEKVFGPDDTNPCVIRNPGCKFTEKVLDYIFFEWEVEVTQYPHEVQNKAMDMIDRETAMSPTRRPRSQWKFFPSEIKNERIQHGNL
jgi:hypothetical protein